MLNVKMVSDDCKIHRSVSLVSMAHDNYREAIYCMNGHFISLLTDLVQNISLFPLFSMVLTAILDSNLEFYGQDSLKHNKYPSIRFAISKLAENDTSFVSTTHLIQEISVFVFFQYGVGSHVWAAILDLNVKNGLRK